MGIISRSAVARSRGNSVNRLHSTQTHIYVIDACVQPHINPSASRETRRHRFSQLKSACSPCRPWWGKQTDRKVETSTHPLPVRSRTPTSVAQLDHRVSAIFSWMPCPHVSGPAAKGRYLAAQRQTCVTVTEAAADDVDVVGFDTLLRQERAARL